MATKKSVFRIQSWTDIEDAGGAEAFIKKELSRRGVLLPSPRMNIIDIKSEKEKFLKIKELRMNLNPKKLALGKWMTTLHNQSQHNGHQKNTPNYLQSSFDAANQLKTTHYFLEKTWNINLA